MASSLLHLVASIAVVFNVLATTGSCQQLQNASFGECQEEPASCRDCYLELVRAVLGRDGNIFNLSRVFTPPVFDHPSFVTVYYRFVNETCNKSSEDVCVDEIHTWFWAKSGAYLLHPLVTFEFISLLFGNAVTLYEREVYVTLDATECYGVNPDHMTLLTQRLKIYLQQQSFYPQMQDTYIPVAANSTNLLAILNSSYYSPLPLSSEDILFACPLVATALVLAILLLLYAVSFAGICGLKSKGKTGLKNQDKATILAVSIISFIRIVIFTVFDGVALKFRLPCSDLKVATVCEFSSFIHDVPLALLTTDCFMGACSIALTIPAGIIHLLRFSRFKDRVNEKSIQDRKYYLLAGIALCFIICCLMHIPYITMAYLSDAHYATSILVYYMTILFIEFGMVQYVLRLYYDSRAGSHTQYGKKYCGAIGVTIAMLILLLLLLYGVVITASLFYYYLPLINVVTDLPNEGVIVYQTALILIGAYITYRTLFRAQKKKKDVYIINCRVKENKISQLRTEIKRLKFEKSEGYQNKIANLSKKILRLQKEVQLGLIQSNIACLTNENESSINQRKIVYLYKQWKVTFDELKAEIDEINSEAEKKCLRNELLYHLNQMHELTEEKIDLNPTDSDLQEELDTAISDGPLSYLWQGLEDGIELHNVNEHLENHGEEVQDRNPLIRETCNI